MAEVFITDEAYEQLVELSLPDGFVFALGTTAFSSAWKVMRSL